MGNRMASPPSPRRAPSYDDPDRPIGSSFIPTIGRALCFGSAAHFEVYTEFEGMPVAFENHHIVVCGPATAVAQFERTSATHICAVDEQRPMSWRARHYGDAHHAQVREAVLVVGRRTRHDAGVYTPLFADLFGEITLHYAYQQASSMWRTREAPDTAEVRARVRALSLRCPRLSFSYLAVHYAHYTQRGMSSGVVCTTARNGNVAVERWVECAAADGTSAERECLQRALGED